MSNSTVSIVIPNLNGQPQLKSCLSHVEKLDWNRDSLECIVVDNGSIDGSLYFLRKYHPWVKTVELNRNHGFASAINIGAKQASGNVLVFLNNDTMPKSDFLIHLVKPIADQEISCTAAKILSSDSKRVLFAGGGMNFHGLAFQRGEGCIDQPKFNVAGSELFACGAAMAIRKEVFLSSGGFDDDFFAYFEDVDLGWRLWKLGHEIRYVPKSTVCHLQSGTSQWIDRSKIRVLHMRNPLVMIYKNYDEEHLESIFHVALMLSIFRMKLSAGINSNHYRINEESLIPDYPVFGSALQEKPDTSISKIAVADMVAINDVLSLMPRLIEKRTDLHQKSVRKDEQLFPMFRAPLRYAEKQPEYKKLHDQLVNQYKISDIFSHCPSLET